MCWLGQAGASGENSHDSAIHGICGNYRSRVWRSLDGGESWPRLRPALYTETEVRALAVFRSKDGGRHRNQRPVPLAVAVWQWTAFGAVRRRQGTVPDHGLPGCPGYCVMPFTFAHPAAAVPLHRPLGRYGVLSALVIGSLVPDFAYFLPLGVARTASHSLTGLLWFCLPVGVAAYLVFHLFLKLPLLSLLPVSVSDRLTTFGNKPLSLPQVSWLAVTLSLLLGAVTHVVWDAFTHNEALAVAALPWLRVHLFSLGNYHVYPYKLLQHASTAMGLGLIAWWGWRWARSTPAGTSWFPWSLSAQARTCVILALLVVSAGVACVAAMQSMPATSGVLAIQAFVSKAVFAGIRACGLLVLAYSVAWHVWVLHGRRCG
jgi:hypothetical protein